MTDMFFAPDRPEPYHEEASVRTPKQARSVETYHRLLDAAEEVLEEKSFDEATVGEIAARAGMTTGAVYARFENKEALLRHLEERVRTEMNQAVDRVVERDDLAGQSAGEILHALVAAHVAEYRRHRSAGRAMVLRSRFDPELRQRLQELNRRNLGLAYRLLARHVEIDHPEPVRALRFALLTLRSLVRETVLFDEGFPATDATDAGNAGDAKEGDDESREAARTDEARLSDDELVDEITRVVLAYLGIDPAATAERETDGPAPPEEDP